MGAPNITIAFYEQAVETIKRGDKGILAMILKQKPVAVPMSEEHLGKRASDLMCADVKLLADGSVIGTFPYTTDFTQFSAGDAGLQEGYYYALQLDDSLSGKTIAVRRTSNGGGEEKKSEDLWWILRLTDGVETVYEFRIKDEDKPFLTLSFAGSKLLDKGVDRPETAEAAKYERFRIVDVTDIPDVYSAENKQAVEMALLGYVNAPKLILACLIDSEEQLDDALKALSADNWDYLVYPTAETDGKGEALASWIKSQRSKNHKPYKAVLPNTAADSEGVINVTTWYERAGVKMMPEQACARVAGILCGTPWSISCTYAPLTDATGCEIMEPEDLDMAVDSGELVFMWDGEKAKICRGVNSMVTTTENKGLSYKKIKLVEILDRIQTDISKTMQDAYIGKYANTYDNKCLLTTAINGYFDTLIGDGILSSGYCEIDLDANWAYVKSKGGKFILADGEYVALEEATQEQIKHANTDSFVFLKATISMVDAIEDITLKIYL